jgi:hypothetical protein
MTRPPSYVGPSVVEYRAGRPVLIDSGTGVVIAEAVVPAERAPMPVGDWPRGWCGKTEPHPAHGHTLDGFTHWCHTQPRGATE